MDGPSPLELIVRGLSNDLDTMKKEVSRLDMLIKFYHPGYPYKLNKCKYISI